MKLGEKIMRLGKKTSRAISIALLAAMASTSLPQVDVIAAVKNGMFLSVSYTDKDGNNNKEGTENTVPDESEQSEGAEPVQNEETGAASNSGVQENSEEQTSNNTSGSSQNNAANSNSFRETSYNNGYSSYNGDYDSSETSITENPLTAGNRVSDFITLDKQAIGFTKVGDVVSVTASLAENKDDEIVWRVADPTILLIKSTSVDGKNSTAQIEWIGGTETTKFFAGLKSDPDEYTEGTAMLFDNNSSSEQSDTNENKELKREFESPEVEEFLREMQKEGLSQENSDYDLSKLSDENKENNSEETERKNSTSLELFDSEKISQKLEENQLSEENNTENNEVKNDESNSEEKTTENVENTTTSDDEKSENQNENDRVSSYYNSTSDSEEKQTKTETSVETKTVTETVQEKSTQNVNRETVVKQTVSTEILSTEQTGGTVTKTVEKQVPKQVTKNVEETVEREVEREIVNENGETETVTETIEDTITTPVVETVYETVEETVEEETPIETQYTVRETTTTETTTTETVTDEKGNVISSKVVDNSTSTSSRDYTTTEMPSTETKTSTSTSSSSDTVENVTGKEVEKTVTNVVEKEVTVDSANNESVNKNETISENTENVNSNDKINVDEIIEFASDDNANDNSQTTETITPAESTTEVTSTSNSSTTMYAIEPKQTSETSESLAKVDITEINEKLVANYNISVLSDSGGTSAVSDPNEIINGSAVSDLEGIDTIEIRVGEKRTLGDILPDKGLQSSLTATNTTILDSRLATVLQEGSYASGVTITGVQEGRTRITAQIGGKFRIFNLEVYGSRNNVVLPTAVPMVVANGSFTLALKSDGTVWGWGLAGDHQLGNLKVTGDTQNTPYKIEIKENGKLSPLTNIKHIAVGDAHALAVNGDGRVYAWGLNRNGQLGSGYKITGSNPAYVLTAANTPLENIKYVAAGNFSSYAISADGKIYSWGSNIYGQLGNGQYGGNEIENNGYDSDVVYATEISVDADGNDFSNIIKIAAGISHVLALKNDGNLYVWGTNSDSLLVSTSTEDVLPLPSKMELSVDGQVLDVAAGGGTNSSGSSGDEGKQQLRFHSMILTNTGSVYVWGHNEENTLGKDDNNNSSEIEKLESIKNVISINAARYNSSAITSDGKVYTWGRNDEGQIGNVNVASRTNEPMNVMAGATNSEDEESSLENIVAIAIGANHMTALRLDGKVYSWGTDMLGQLGDGRNGYEYEKVDLPVLTGTAASNSLIMDHVKVVSADTNEIAGEYESSESMPEIITITDAQKVKIEIPEIKKYYKSGFNLIENDQKFDITSATIFSSSNEKIAGVSADTVEINWETVSPVSLENGGERGIVEIKAENEGFYGILKVHVKAPNEFTTPMIASGENFTIALKSDGSVWAWGDNTYGQLGNGNFESSQGPIPVLAVDATKKLSGVFKIAAGKYHALAMTSDGAVLAWGLNDNGQLGNNSTTNQNVPVKVFGGEHSSVNGFITLANDIAAGGKHSLVALSTGAVYAWGANNHAQLGNTRDENDITSTSKELTPVRVIQGASAEDGSSAYIDSAVAVAAGENHSLALLGANTEVPDMDRVVLTWGANNYGQMGSDIIVGDGEVSSEPSDEAWNQLVPTELSADGTIITNIGAIAAGKNHSVLLEYSVDGTGGKVYTVGSNEYGQLGRNSTSKFLSDVTPLASSDVTDNVVDEKKDSITTVTGIAAGGNNTIIIDAEGNVYNFGDNRHGQLGMGSVGGSKNVAVSNNNFSENGQAIAAGSQSGFVMKKDGYVWAFGYDSDGQLGDLSREDSSVPVLVGSGAEDVLQLSVTVPTSDGGTKDIVNPNTVTVNKNQTIKANGGNIISLRGFNLIVNDDEVKKATSITYSSSDDSVVSVNGTTITAVSKGIAVIKAVSSTGVVGMFVVHVNDLSEDAFYTEPMVSAGENFSVALKSDGTVWTWGENKNGQLGNGTKGDGTSQYSPVQVVGVSGTSDSVLKNIVAVAAGDTHAVALSVNGEVYTWGGNMYGQLGNGTSGIESAIEGDEEEVHDAVEFDENTGYYTIYAAEGLEKVREVLDGKFILGKDITLSSAFAPIGDADKPFTGIFDGNGYRINNLNVSSSATGTNIGDNKTSVSAMFAVNNGTIQNVILNSISVSNTTLEVEDNDMSVPAYSISAGLVGFNDGTVSNSGIVLGQISSYNLSGGLVAYNGEHGTISNVYNRADVRVVNSETSVSIKYAGGITAVNLGNIFRAYNSGSVSGTSDISGVAGISASNMAESSADAQAGVEYGIAYTYTNNGTVVGVGNEAAASLANADLTDSSIYAGWNFEDGSGVWSFTNKYDENDKLPILQIEQGPPAAPAETDYTTKDSGVPVTIVSEDGKEIGKISAIAAGGNHTLVLTEDGYVYSFGSNGNGQLGVGSNGYDSTTSLAKYKTKATKVLGGRSASSDIYLSNIIRISAGKEFSSALKSNGMVVTWGNNDNGQLGINVNGLRNQPVKVITNNSNPLENITDISLGANHVLALAFDNSLYAWGANDRRQLASSTKDIVPVPEKITISGKIKTIAAGGQHSAIMTTLDGSEDTAVLTWGDNEYGQLGIKDANNDISRNATPTRVNKGITVDSTDDYLINVIGLSTGGSHTVVIKDDGYVYSWGLNESGQIGDISNETRRTPVLTGDREARVLMMQKITAKKADGSVAKEYTGNDVPVEITIENNGSLEIDAAETIEKYLSGFNMLKSVTESKTADSTKIEFATSDDTVALINQLGVVSATNKIGKATIILRNTDTNYIGSIIVNVTESIALPKVDSGVDFAVALSASGLVYTWGKNSIGQLGIDTATTYRPIPQALVGIPQMTTIAAGDDFVVALDVDGNIWTWGNNENGQLGRGDIGEAYSATPQMLSVQANSQDVKFINVAAGKDFAFALTTSGSVYSWGTSSRGQLGNGATSNSNVPKSVVKGASASSSAVLEDVIKVTASDNFAAVLKRNGDIFVWGDNTVG